MPTPAPLLRALLPCFLFGALLAAVPAVPLPPAALVRHPHFPKRVEMRLGLDEDAKTIAVSHLTATFDAAGFEAMDAGGTWHLANGHFTTEVDLEVGGHEITAGEYRLLARKLEGEGWELVLDPAPGRFDRKVSEGAMSLETRFESGQPRQEHLRLDLQPAGEGEEVALFLEVHFDTHVARARIVVP